jgi:hypothetical protein
MFARIARKGRDATPRDLEIRGELDAWLAAAFRRYLDSGESLAEALALPRKKPGPKMPLSDVMHAGARAAQLEAELGDRAAAVHAAAREMNKSERSIERYYEEWKRKERLVALLQSHR